MIRQLYSKKKLSVLYRKEVAQIKVIIQEGVVRGSNSLE